MSRMLDGVAWLTMVPHIRGQLADGWRVGVGGGGAGERAWLVQEALMPGF
jgi:hypothetical protein